MKYVDSSWGCAYCPFWMLEPRVPFYIDSEMLKKRNFCWKEQRDFLQLPLCRAEPGPAWCCQSQELSLSGGGKDCKKLRIILALYAVCWMSGCFAEETTCLERIEVPQFGKVVWLLKKPFSTSASSESVVAVFSLLMTLGITVCLDFPCTSFMCCQKDFDAVSEGWSFVWRNSFVACPLTFPQQM